MGLKLAAVLLASASCCVLFGTSEGAKTFVKDSSPGRLADGIVPDGRAHAAGLRWLSKSRDMRVCSWLKGTCCQKRLHCCDNNNACCDSFNWFYPTIDC